MKIAYILGSLNPGGSEKQTAQIVVRLRELGHDITVLLPHGAGQMPGNLNPYMEAHQVPMIDLGAQSDKVAAITEELLRIAPEATCSNGYPVTVMGSLAAYLAEVPLRIIRIEDCGLMRNLWPQYRIVELAGYAVTHTIVGNSLATLDCLSVSHGTEFCKTQVIPNGVTIPPKPSLKAARETSRRYWGAHGKILVGNLANLRADGYKNQVMLVRAARRVLNEEPNVKFLLVGYHSAYTDTVQAETARLGLIEDVHTPGRIDDLNLLAGWDISVNCSHTEGLSNAVQECMAYGLPTVATAVGGNPELVEDGKTGLLVPDDDDAALAEAILRLIRDEQLRKSLGGAARRRMQEHHNWDNILGQWTSLYDRGLEEVSHA
jgi:glycosyltransferase involved in cell wall biosynthesis